jgi:epidermal growth factor receptor substrate 15
MHNFRFSGFSFVKELTLDVQNVIAPPKEKSKSVSNEKASTVESPTAASSPNADVKVEKPQTMDEQGVENGLAYNRSEDGSVKSAPSSPFARSVVESPPRDFPDSNFDKAIGADASPRNKDYQRYSSKICISFPSCNMCLVDTS